MRVLMGMVGVLLMFMLVVGLVLAGVCGLDVEDVTLELGVPGITALAEMPATPPTIDAACGCAIDTHSAAAAECYDSAIGTCTIHDNRPTTEASGAAGVRHGIKAGHDDLDTRRAIRSGRFTGAPA